MKKLLTLLIILSVITSASELKLKSLTENKALTLNKQLTPYNLTLKELKEFNGKDGKKAFIAVDGNIYDVTNVKAWTGGVHKKNNAGEDVSEKVKKAPHGESVLKTLNIVGKIVGIQK